MQPMRPIASVVDYKCTTVVLSVYCEQLQHPMITCVARPPEAAPWHMHFLPKLVEVHCTAWDYDQG
jgi:hypothetical protein